MDYLYFLKRLKETRVANGFSQERMAKALGKSKQYFSLVENNKLPLKVDDYFRFCQVLNIHPATIFYGDIPRFDVLDIERNLLQVSDRDLRIIKDLAMLMSLDTNDL